MKNWNDDETAIITEMWLIGINAHKIAATVGRSVDSLRGRIFRLGLKEKQGAGIMFNKNQLLIERGIHETFKDVFKRSRHVYAVGNQKLFDDVASILIAMIADGRNSLRIPQIAHVKQSLVDKVEIILIRENLWPRGPVSDPVWWDDGHAGVVALTHLLTNRIYNQ